MVGGQLLKGQVSLQHALNFTGGGWLSIFIPGQDVESGYEDPDPFKSHTFTLSDQWETLYIHRGGPQIDPRLPSHIRTLVSDLAKRRDCADILNKFADQPVKKGKLDEIEPTAIRLCESVFGNENRKLARAFRYLHLRVAGFSFTILLNPTRS